MGGNINMVDRIADKMRESELGTFLKDEDIYDIVKEAIQVAFFTPRKDSYGRVQDEAVLVQVARKAFLDAMSTHMAESAKQIAETSEFQVLVQDAILGQIVQAARDSVPNIVNQAMSLKVGTDMQGLRYVIERVWNQRNG